MHDLYSAALAAFADHREADLDTPSTPEEGAVRRLCHRQGVGP